MTIEGVSCTTKSIGSTGSILETQRRKASEVIGPTKTKPELTNFQKFQKDIDILRENLLKKGVRDSTIKARIYPFRAFEQSIRTPVDPKNSESLTCFTILTYSPGEFPKGPKVTIHTYIPDPVVETSYYTGRKEKSRTIEVVLKARVNLEGGFTSGYIKVSDDECYSFIPGKNAKRIFDFVIDTESRIDKSKAENILKIAGNNFSFITKKI